MHGAEWRAIWWFQLAPVSNMKDRRIPDFHTPDLHMARLELIKAGIGTASHEA